MKPIRFIRSVSSLLIFFVLISCSSDVYKTVYPTLVDGRYDSEFPYNSSSEQLEEISSAVKLLNTIAFYSSHIFSEGSKIKLSDLNEEVISNNAINSTFYNHTASGTATVIYSQNRSVALLTCAHIIDYPDTVISYFKTPTGAKTKYIQSFSVRERQSIYVTDLPEFGEVEILLLDRARDIAIVGKEFKSVEPQNIPVFTYPIGSAKQLDWGTFVYIFGYPMNLKMVTKGIVSSPNKDGKGSFLIDAVFNRGFSGGIVLAIRDGIPNFEMVGLVRSVPAEYENVLKPVPSDEPTEYNPIIPYNGNIYVEQRVNMKYGITRVIAVEEIIGFIKENQSYLESRGIYLNRFTD